MSSQPIIKNCKESETIERKVMRRLSANLDVNGRVGVFNLRLLLLGVCLLFIVRHCFRARSKILGQNESFRRLRNGGKCCKILYQAVVAVHKENNCDVERFKGTDWPSSWNLLSDYVTGYNKKPKQLHNSSSAQQYSSKTLSRGKIGVPSASYYHDEYCTNMWGRILIMAGNENECKAMLNEY